MIVWKTICHVKQLLLAYLQAVSTVAACDEDYKQALRAPLYARMREYQYSADKANVSPIEKNANEVLPENPTVHNPLELNNLKPSSEIVEEESEHNTSFKADHLATVFSNQPAMQAQQVKSKHFISPEVEQALGILDTAIAVLQGNRPGNIGALKKFLSNGATSEEGSATGSRNPHTIIDTDSLPSGCPLTTPPRDSRYALRHVNTLCVGFVFQLMVQQLHGHGNIHYNLTYVYREIGQAYSLHDEEVRDREEGAFDGDSPKNMTASTITATKSTTLRSTTKVHEEESLNTDGLRQNGFHGDKEPKRARRTNRWLWCLTPQHRMTRAHRRSSRS